MCAHDHFHNNRNTHNGKEDLWWIFVRNIHTVFTYYYCVYIVALSEYTYIIAGEKNESPFTRKNAESDKWKRWAVNYGPRYGPRSEIMNGKRIKIMYKLRTILFHSVRINQTVIGCWLWAFLCVRKSSAAAYIQIKECGFVRART